MVGPPIDIVHSFPVLRRLYRSLSLLFCNGTPFQQGAAIGGANAVAVPVAHKVPPDQGLQFLNGKALRVEAAIEKFALHPGPHSPVSLYIVYSIANSA